MLIWQPVSVPKKYMNNMTGIVLKAISGFYYVCADGNIYECKARGNFRKAGISPAVGDRVEITLTDEVNGVLEKICERKSLIERPLIANIDKLFIVSSYKTPEPDALMIDRLTAFAVYSGIEPIVVFNKSDMGDFSNWKEIYEKSGLKTYVVSAAKNDGINELKNELKDCICAFAGNSGVGKSSILNALFGDLELKTGDVSDKLGRGRHTTRHTELFKHKLGGFVADTPGFSSVEEENLTYDFKINLECCFPEFEPFISECRFTGCTHTCEKGCAIIKAVENGEISRSRHNSYTEIYNSMKDIKEWTFKKK